MKAAVFAFLAVSAAAAADTAVPQDSGDVFAKGLRRLEAIEARLRAYPDSAGPHIDRLRVTYVLGVKKERYLADAEREAAWLLAHAAGDAERINLARAYRGAITVAYAKHGFNPNRKLRLLKAAGPALDSAVAAAPEEAEPRYLRLVSGYYLPFFLGRKDSVEADFAALARILPGVTGKFPPDWYRSIAGFVMDKGDLPEPDRVRLAGCIRQAATRDPGLAGNGAAE